VNGIGNDVTDAKGSTKEDNATFTTFARAADQTPTTLAISKGCHRKNNYFFTNFNLSSLIKKMRLHNEEKFPSFENEKIK